MAFQKWSKTVEPTRPNEITIIHAGCSLEGSIETSGIIQINGKFKGIIKSAAELRVGIGGEIFGEVHADTARIGGKVQGDVYVEGKLFLEGSSSLHGNICVGKLIADEGAVFVGQSLMKGAKSGRPVPTVDPIMLKPQKDVRENSPRQVIADNPRVANRDNTSSKAG